MTVRSGKRLQTYIHSVFVRTIPVLLLANCVTQFLIGQEKEYDPIRFDLQEGSGVDFEIEPSRGVRRRQPETMISGVALFDYNDDGYLDIYAVSGATMPGLVKTQRVHMNRLYRGNGDFTFEDVTGRAGLAGRGYTQGVAVGDYDNDGDSDLFVAGLRENILYRNNGDGSFGDVTSEAGLAVPDSVYGTLWGVAAAFFDCDLDGHLDLFVSNYCVWDPDKEPLCGPSDRPDYCHPRYYDGLPNSLFRNTGQGTFNDVSQSSGIRQFIGKGMGLGVADFDADGLIDVYVANDTVPAFLFRNLGDCKFEEIGLQSGSAYAYSGAAVSGMGADARDVNNDGRPDIFVAAMMNEVMPLYINLGNGYFDEVTAPSRLAMLTRDKTGWSNGIFDFNNDGWKDLFVASSDVGHPEGPFRHRVAQPNTLFANLGNGKFADAGPAAGSEFATRKAVHRGAAFGDIDNDGRIDVVVTALNGPTEVWRNVSPVPNHWLTVSLKGTRSNRDGMGAVIRITTSSGSQSNHVNTAVGFGSASDKRVHFGLGKDGVVEEVRIKWPSGAVQVLKNVQADQILAVTEPEG